MKECAAEDMVEVGHRWQYDAIETHLCERTAQLLEGGRSPCGSDHFDDLFI